MSRFCALGPEHLLLLSWLVLLACDDGARVSTDAAVNDVSLDGQSGDGSFVDGSLLQDGGESTSCAPSGGCPEGPQCLDGCCGAGERCMNGECFCGSSGACGGGESCTPLVPFNEDFCGDLCCGETFVCPE